MTKPVPPTAFPPAEPESLSQLRRDCARMAPHWTTARHTDGSTAARSAAPASPPPSAEPERPRGVSVSARSAHLLDGMSEYGD